jgi:hypothetical protein
MHGSPHDDIPISDRTLDALRTTAAMLLAVPGLGAQVRIGDDVLLEVRRPPFPDGVSHRILPPCGFHAAVVGAHRMRRSGERVGMRGVPASLEPSIDWGLAVEGRTLPGRIVRLHRDTTWWHVVPVGVADETLLAVLDDDRFCSIARHRDDDLDVVLLHAATTAGDECASASAVERLLDAIAAIGIADLEHRLGAGDADPSRRN